MHKLIAKVQEIKADQNGINHPKNTKKHFAGKVAAPPPHPNLTTSVLGARKPLCQQNKTKKENKLAKKIQNKNTTKNTAQYAQR